MKFKPVKLAPFLITVGVILLVCLLRFWRWDFLERLERITYDQRVRAALRYPQPTATNLAAIFITDSSLVALNNRSLGYNYGINWPRHIYGRVLREAAQQGAQAVAFDVLFGEPREDVGELYVDGERRREALEFLKQLHPDQAPINLQQGDQQVSLIDSDEYFAWQLKRSHRAILAAEQGVIPYDLLATNALELGDISADADPDGVLRRAKAFRSYRLWHPLFRTAAYALHADLGTAVAEPGQIVLSPQFQEKVVIPVDAENNFEPAGFPPNMRMKGLKPKERAYTVIRVWHMGIVLAARQLGLDLANADVNLDQGRIILRGPNGAQKILPVDREGYLLINWELTAGDRRLVKLPLEVVLKQDQDRSAGATNELSGWLKDTLVVLGSTATGNNMTDRGATPLEKSTYLISKHWNVANSVLTGRFVQRASFGVELLAIVLLAVMTAFLSWQFRIFSAAGGVILMGVLYTAFAFYLYIHYRYWLPIVLPLGGAALVEYLSLVTYRVVFEQAEQRRVKSLFSQVVSPNIVNVLLDLEKLSLEGARHEVTVFFADVRGFTELTDANQEKAEAFVRAHNLNDAAANAYFDEEAQATLNTVNFYLALVADMVKRHDGTLDKYIGDCVMAFWGAPTPNPKHALACVSAAIDAQRAIYEINQKRAVERAQLEIENRARESAGLTPKPLPPSLALGTGINTGKVTVGLMGSEDHIRNYTVFGREVNLASRLEGVSGHGRIVIGETTYQHLLRDDPALAARCIELEPTKPKGFKKPVRIYEVPWLPPGAVKSPVSTTTAP